MKNIKNLLFLFLILMTCATGYAQTWEKVPKRTQAQATAGLSGGEGWQMIFGIQYAPSNPDVAYFVTDTNQVWKTINANDAVPVWNRKANGFLCNGGLSLAIDPTDEDIVYVAGSGHNNAGNETVTLDVEGILRTTDGGDNWTLVTTQSYATHAPQAHFHKDSGGSGKHIAFAGTDLYAVPSGGGMLRSADGITWSLVAKNGGGYVLDTVDCRNISIHPSSIAGSATCFVSATNGLWRVRYNNGSATVTAIGSGLPSYPHQITFGTSTPNTIYAADATSGVYRSTDGGVTFSARNNGLSSPISGGGSAKFISMSPVNGNKLMVSFQNVGGGGNQVYYTNDGGANWVQATSMDEKNADGWVAGSTLVTNPLLDTEAYTRGTANSYTPIAMHPTDQNIALTHGYGNIIKKTTDGGITWKYANTGYIGSTESQYGSIPIGWDSTNANRATFFHTDFGAMITTDGEDTFSNIKTTYNGRVDAKCGAMRDNIIVAAIGPTSGQRIHVSRDSGASWTAVPGMDTNFFMIAWHPQNSNIVYADKWKFSNIQTNNIYGTNTGSQWVSAVNQTDGDIVYSFAGTTTPAGGHTIKKSLNAGVTWHEPYPAIPTASGKYIKQIAIDPVNENRIYAAVQGEGVYILNGSNTVQLKDDSDGLELSQFGSVDTYCVVVDPNVNYNGTTTVYVGTLRHNRGMTPGIFRSVDAGLNWTNITGNLDNVNVVNLSVNPNNSYVYLDSYSGTWKLPPPGASGTGTPGSAPAVTTGTATVVTSTTAIFNAEVIPNGSPTTARFQYGTAPGNYTTNTGSQTVGAGTSSVGIQQAVTGLTGSTTYYVRAQANSVNGSTNGSETTFTTDSRLSLNVSMGTPTVNGSLSDWSAIVNPIAFVISGTMTAANGSWSAKWNNTGLHFAFVGSDTTLYADSGNNTYLDDGFEIYIDRDNNKGTSYDVYDYHLGWNYNGTFTRAYNGTTTGIVIGTSSASGGYIIEVTIPWSVFPGGIVPSGTITIGVDVQFNDDSNGGNSREMAKGWNAEVGADTDYFNPSTFGEFVLLGEGSGGGGGTETVASAIGAITGLVGGWHMDEGSGSSTADFSGNNNRGTLTGGVRWGSSTTNLGSSTVFNGTTGTLTVGSPSVLDNVTPISVSFWARLITMGESNDGNIFRHEQNGTVTGRLSLGSDVNKKFYYFRDYTATDLLRGSGTDTIKLNTWQNWVVTDEGSSTATSVKLYVDGVEAVYDTVTPGFFVDGVGTRSSNASASWLFGNNIADTAAVNGSIDEYRIYNKILSTQDILDLRTIGSVTVGVGSPTSITQISAIANGTVTPNGSSTFNGYFRWGTVAGVYTGTSTEQLIGTGSTPIALSRTITGLSANTTYYYAPVAYNAAGIHVKGSETSFTTLGVDSMAPVGTVTINSNGTYTTTTGVTLNLSATDAIGVTGYYLSGSTTTPTAGQAGWAAVGTTTSYTADVPYTLTSSDGTKTVYVWYKDGVGNISAMAQDSIALDETFPTIVVVSPSSIYTDDLGRKALGTTGTTITIQGNAYDDNGIGTVTISNSGTTTTRTATGTDTWNSTEKIYPVLSDGLVGYWKLDEIAGSIAYDSSPYFAANGTITGAAVGTLSVFGGSRYFDGIDDRIDMGDNSQHDFGTSASFSISALVSRSVNGTADTIVSKAGMSTTNRYMLLLNSDNRIVGYMEDGASTAQVISSNTITNTTFHHIVWVCGRDGSSTSNKLFLDGAEVSYNTQQVAITNSLINSIPFTIGTYYYDGSYGNFLKGDVDEVRIYNRAFSNAEVLQLYQLTTPDQVNVFSVTAQDMSGNQGTDTVSIGAFPSVTTDYAISVVLNSATLVGSCTANNNTTTVWFDYGTIEGYYTGSSSTVTVTGSTDTAVNIALGSLSRGTTVYYRISGSNTVGVTHGEVFNFTTGPGVVTGGQFNNMDMSYPGSTKFNVYLKSLGIYPGLLWARNYGTSDQEALKADPDTVLSEFLLE